MSKILSYAFFVTLLAAALVGCGGGEADELDQADGTKGAPLVDCSAKPEQCR